MLDPAVLEIADRWWAQDFACGADELRPATTHVQPHAGRMVDASGIWILVAGPSPLVSLPPVAQGPLATRARAWSAALVADPAALGKELQSLPVERIVGPAFIGYGTKGTLELSAAAGAQVVTPAHDEAVGQLRAACSEEEWDHGGSDHHAVPCFGSFDSSGTLLAMAGYKTWDDEIAHIAIVSARQGRGRGLASQAVARAAQHAIDAGLLPQYRTLASNAPSMGVARKLGFQRYGFSVFVRLRTN